jgi:hypothetical protein
VIIQPSANRCPASLTGRYLAPRTLKNGALEPLPRIPTLIVPLRQADIGGGPGVSVSCSSGELHDIALMIFGIALNRNWWRIGCLGPSTPIGPLLPAS